MVAATTAAVRGGRIASGAAIAAWHLGGLVLGAAVLAVAVAAVGAAEPGSCFSNGRRKMPRT